MPLYEYFCSSCHTKFDALRPMSEADTPIKCEQCESPRTARVLSMFFASSNGKPIEGMSSGGGCACGGHCGCGHSHN
jgi:putative FmdB family regulatory protein